MYVKRAMMNDAKRIMIVIASFNSMASPPFEGKPCPPKIQLYIYYTILLQTKVERMFANEDVEGVIQQA
jgi:hypothetical protein